MIIFLSSNLVPICSQTEMDDIKRMILGNFRWILVEYGLDTLKVTTERTEDSMTFYPSKCDLYLIARIFIHLTFLSLQFAIIG